MTIILQTTSAGKSKAALKAALEAKPADVAFHDPSFLEPRWFTGEDVKFGERFAVVMDHPKRMRFALITRTREGGWKVE